MNPTPAPSRPAASPWFALTLTVRNNAETIRPSLASLLPALEEGGELTIADAASTDGTLEAIREIADRDPRVRFTSEPCSRGGGRNRAVALTRAPIVATHLDADNLYETNVLREAVRALREDPGRRALNVVGRNDPNPSSTRFFVWPREALDRIGGYPDVQLAEDLGVVLRAFRAGVPFRRRLVPTVARDLKPRASGHGSSVSPWRRGHVSLRASRKFALLGYRYSEFVRYLALTRRTALRYLAGTALGADGYLEFAASGRSDEFLRDGLGETPEEIREVTSSPDWPGRA